MMPAIGRQPTTQPRQQMHVKPNAKGLPVVSEEKYKDWLNPINKTVLVSTFRHKVTHVKLDNREFLVDYDKRPGYAWVHPKSGQNVPCGWFELDRSTSRDFFNG